MHKKYNDGFGLIQALVLIFVGSLLIAIVSKKAGMVSKASKKTESISDLSSIKNQLYNNIDCSETFAQSRGFGPKGTPCSTPKYINLRTRTGVVVRDDGSTKAGKWNVMAYCSAAGVDLRAVSLLPPHVGNLEDKKWAGKALPANPDHYRKDELTKRPYSWNHPASRLSKPGAGGLCEGWFVPSNNSNTCNGLVTNVDLKSENVTCAEMPVCSYPDDIVFVGGKYICDSKLVTEILDKNKDSIDEMTGGIVKNFNTNVSESVVLSVNEINESISNYPNMGGKTDITRSTDGECATRATMKCPEGFVMWGYEARQRDAGKNCRVRCVKLKPPQ